MPLWGTSDQGERHTRSLFLLPHEPRLRCPLSAPRSPRQQGIQELCHLQCELAFKFHFFDSKLECILTSLISCVHIPASDMSPNSSTPIVIGVGDFINRSKRVEDAVEPLHLMLNAIEEAIGDAGLSESSSQRLRAAVDSLDVVRTWTWPYPDLPGLIAERLRINPRRKHYTDHGGNKPGLVFDEAARRISKGETKVAILTGGEALASCTHPAPLSSPRCSLSPQFCLLV